MMLRVSGVEAKFVEMLLEGCKWSGDESRPLSGKEQARYQKMCRKALRCNIARQLTEKEYQPYGWEQGLVFLGPVYNPAAVTLAKWVRLAGPADEFVGNPCEYHRSPEGVSRPYRNPIHPLLPNTPDGPIPARVSVFPPHGIICRIMPTMDGAIIIAFQRERTEEAVDTDRPFFLSVSPVRG